MKNGKLKKVGIKLANTKDTYQERGITLIALVITIILLIILAGVSINSILGKDGLMSKAKIAREEQKKAEVKESIELAILDIQTGKISKGEECTIDTIISEIPSKIKGIIISKDGDNAKGTYKECDFTITSDLKVSVKGNIDNNENNLDVIKIYVTEKTSTHTIELGATPQIVILDEQGKDITSTFDLYSSYKYIYLDKENKIAMTADVQAGDSADFNGKNGTYYVNFTIVIAGEKHVCNYDEGVVTNEPTCVENGIKTYTCNDCGKTYTEEIPATGHNYENEICTKCGQAEYVEYTYSGYAEGLDVARTGNVIVPETFEYNNTKYRITKIGDHAFYYTDITSIVLPNSVTSINYNAFAHCTNLISVTLSDNIETIEGGAFNDCTSLTSVIYQGVTYTTRSALETKLRDNNVSIGSDGVFGCLPE